MDRRLLGAAVSGDATKIVHLDSEDPSLLHGTTPQGNTCLHIASIHGHEEFCKAFLALSQSLPLLTTINADGEMPLLAAVTNGRVSLASFLLRFCRDQELSAAILNKDKRECNALHHAVRSGYSQLTFELIAAEPALSRAVNEHDESPMFIAVMRNDQDAFEKLLKIPDSAHGGAYGYNALHAAVRNDNAGESDPAEYIYGKLNSDTSIQGCNVYILTNNIQLSSFHSCLRSLLS
jgi:ankyrin repeat protein